jgi:hypothetical protein
MNEAKIIPVGSNRLSLCSLDSLSAGEYKDHRLYESRQNNTFLKDLGRFFGVGEDDLEGYGFHSSRHGWDIVSFDGSEGYSYVHPFYLQHEDDLDKIIDDQEKDLGRVKIDMAFKGNQPIIYWNKRPIEVRLGQTD